MFSKNLLSSLIGKVTTGKKNLALSIWNVAPVINVSSTGLAPSTSGLTDISDITQF